VKKLKLKGQKFGKLTVLEEAPRSDCGNIRWHCLCDCGKKTISPTNSLRAGRSNSCGCILTIDMVGKRSGSLVVVGKSKKTRRGSREVLWECLCDCGGKSTVSGYSLRSKRITSCGCVNNSVRLASGQRFSRLKVIKMAKERGTSGNILWLCKCDCGKKTLAKGSQLKAGATRSCGCLRKLPKKHFTAKEKMAAEAGYKKNSALKITNLADGYVAHRLKKEFGPDVNYKEHPELIKLKRQHLETKRAVREKNKEKRRIANVTINNGIKSH